MINDFLRNLGKTYRELHDSDVLHRIPHPGNILVMPDGKVRLSDFEFGLDMSDMTDPQQLMYRTNELRQIFMSFAHYLNPHLLRDLDALGIKVAQKILEGYFWDKSSVQYGISLTGEDEINDILVRLHQGKDSAFIPIVGNMALSLSQRHAS